MRYREIDKILRADGWSEVKQVGSHLQYKHPAKPGKETDPEHAGTTVKSILKQAGLA